MLAIEQWDIVRNLIRPEDDVWHPCVIISPPEWCLDSLRVKLNVLMCTKKVPAGAAKPYEVLLNGADDLDFLTLCGCQFVHVASRDRLTEKLGRVCPERRRTIKRKLIEVYRFQP